ncbi:MAG: universal stress protein [Syntrophorhabdaceae bacterium]|nr:universal stress protein [Syntrophorhabdaceae bacterium]MDD4195826.1 universal stress protein [Syntrophorhabdaceae bacterium]
MFLPKKILVPTDFSEFSDKALRQAYDLAKQHSAKIYFLHVIGVTQTCAIDYCFDDQTINAIDKKATESSENAMQEQIKRVVPSPDVEIESYVVKGHPYEQILKEQEAKKIDLIVISTHGRTGLVGHLMGSVSEKVARHAKCPVMLVKGTE